MVNHHAHGNARGHPAAGDQAAVDRAGGSGLIEMEGLRIILRGEGQDLGLADRIVPEFGDFTDRVVLEVAFLERDGDG